MLRNVASSIAEKDDDCDWKHSTFHTAVAAAAAAVAVAVAAVAVVVVVVVVVVTS